jgi:uncharacterized membrane protein
MNTLQSLRAPLLVLLALAGVGAASLVWTAQELPANVASHFDAQGQPNGWMTRTSYLKTMAAIGLLLPLLLVGIGLLTALLPASSINLPHRDYWLAPERRDETVRYMARHMAWLACITMALFIALNYLLVEGNRATPPRLSNAIWLLLVAFLAGVVAWIGVLVRRFSRMPPAPQ